jgi:hypothetical protein
MADGLFSGFGTGGAVEQARLETRRKELERMNKLATAVGGNDPKQRAGAEVGVAFGGAFGKALAEGLGIAQESPEIAAAKKDAELLTQINAIEDDPASAAYATKAAQLAQRAGRSDLAFQFGQAAGTRSQAEAKLAAATKKAAVEKEAADLLETERLKNAHELNKLKPNKPPRDITDNDVENVVATMAQGGYGPSTWGDYKWGGYGEEEHAQFARVMAAQVEAEIQKATRDNVEASVPTVTMDLMSDLVARGGVTVDEDNNITGINSDMVNSTFNTRLLGAETWPNAPAIGTVQGGYEYTGGDPALPANWRQQ